MCKGEAIALLYMANFKHLHRISIGDKACLRGTIHPPVIIFDDHEQVPHT